VCAMNIVHTMASEARTPKRRYYSPELKLQVVACIFQPIVDGVSG
jgi:hypothetical protein